MSYTCERCSGPIPPPYSRHYCSDECKRANDRERWRRYKRRLADERRQTVHCAHPSCRKPFKTSDLRVRYCCATCAEDGAALKARPRDEVRLLRARVADLEQRNEFLASDNRELRRAILEAAQREQGGEG